jgi:hypothetical protein
VRGPIDFGYGIADHDHPIIVFDPTPDGRRHTDASGHPASDACGNTQIAENRIEGGVRETAKAFLNDQMLAFLRLQVINDLRAPRALDTMRAVAARRLDSHTPIRERRVRVVGFQHVRKIHDWPSRCSERISQSSDIGDGANEKRHVDVGLGMLPSDVVEIPVPMQEIILHIHKL